MQEAAQIAFSTIKDTLPELKTVKEIRFVLFSEEDLKLHEKVMEEVL